MPEPSEQLTELRQILITSQQEQLKISRSLLAAQQAHAEAVEASLRLNRRVLMMICPAGGRGRTEPLRAVATDMAVRSVIITEEPVPRPPPPPESRRGQAEA